MHTLGINFGGGDFLGNKYIHNLFVDFEQYGNKSFGWPEKIS